MAMETIDAVNHDKKKGMVLPFEPHYITFDEITYFVDMPQEMKNQGVLEDKLVLLHGVSGAFRPGILTALMGVTGAGKTTLMDVLAGRKTSGYTQGNTTISGYPKKQETFPRIAGYSKILLKQGGREIYAGPLGYWSSHLIKYFEGIEGVSKIKDGYNPATWMLEVTTPAQEIALGVDFADIYRNSEQYRRHKAIIKELSTRAPDSKDLYFPTKYSQSLLIQCIACLREQHWSYWRNSSYNAVRFIHTTITALMLGTVFWRLGSKKEKPQDLFNAMGSMYAAVLFLGIKSASAVQPVVAAERTFFYRERASGMYSALPYAFAQQTWYMVLLCIQCWDLKSLLNTKPTHCNDCFIWILFILGPILRICSPTNAGGYLYGGDGTLGHVQCHGRCTD
ncbi:ATP-binding cassette transporter, putative [Ricinus communis]|uniref:ATP-binding cassette transporter, putative n=1 Tax=Ricinus communis TaxID=3988 RepID=B9SMW5_RICCO|nr:ATP-binding cassette transporter, putative [Ricinus communis]